MRYQTAFPLTTPLQHDLIFSLGVAWYVVAVFKLVRLAFG
jgi:hypothetical protein